MAVTAGRQHCWEMPNMLQSPPSAFSPSSGSHPHPEQSPLRAAGFRDIQLHCGDVLCHQEPELSPGSCPKVLLVCVPHGVCSPARPPGLAWPPRSCRDAGRAGRPWQRPREAPTDRRERGGTEHRLPSRSLQTQLDAHPTAEGSASGEEAGAAPNGKGGRPRSRDTVQQWHGEGRGDESWSGRSSSTALSRRATGR